MLGSQTATQIALQPEECRPGYQVYSLVHYGSAAPLPLRLALSPDSLLCVCVQRTVDGVSKSWLSASPAKYVRNARRTSQQCPPPALKPMQLTMAPTSADFSPHAQTGPRSLMCIVCSRMVSVSDKAVNKAGRL